MGNRVRQTALIAKERDILTDARAAVTAFQAANALHLARVRGLLFCAGSKEV